MPLCLFVALETEQCLCPDYEQTINNLVDYCGWLGCFDLFVVHFDLLPVVLAAKLAIYIAVL